MEEQFVSAVSEVQSVELVCHCGKKYKTKGGLERHRAAKHSQNSQAPQLLTQSVLMEIVSTAIQKIKESKVFSEGIRSELSLYQYEVLEEGSEEFKNLKSLFEGHMKNSHVEKFYGKYYGTVPLNSARYFKGLSRNCATLLSTKVADCMLAFCKKEKSVDDSCKESTVTKLSDREKAGRSPVCWWLCYAQSPQETFHQENVREPRSNGNLESRQA
ncbi:hypothetical protein OS493_003961 [Desmophyllum pertusum]|uniref:Uncharacterized protein n=1 Tax=Desmophyllum pertusum TaxID=174260 RepID=A0A9X0D620_9CNID|nr:hypothetical protein OS493_003961 [Desmophyllum pertusum]